MSVSTTIKNQLISKVQSCSSVQVVYGWPEQLPSGWPAVFVVAADMEGDFCSNAENSRVYAYDLLCLFPEGSDMIPASQQNRLDYAEQTIATVVDEIINAVDTDFELDGSPVLFVYAANLVWGTYKYEGGVAKAAQITFKVYTEKTVT